MLTMLATGKKYILSYIIILYFFLLPALETNLEKYKSEEKKEYTTQAIVTKN